MSSGASNSSILIKRSSATAKPSSLQSGELAYSYISNTFFIGTSDGASTLNVGGFYYANTIDNATATNVPGTIVKRDAAGNSYFGNVIVSGYITGQIQGIAQAANTLYYPQNFGVSGGDISASNISFNGSSPVILQASLNSVPGLSAGSVGSSSSIPIIQYGANGRILSVSSASVTISNVQPAFDWANAAYNFANTVATNTTNAFATANSAASFANGAFARANAAYNQANTAETDAQTGITNAASAYSAACTALSTAQSAGTFANGAFVTANSAASFANGAFVVANSAAIFANGAFASANAVQFTITDGTHSNTFYRSGTLTVNSGQGVTAVTSANALTFSTDNTVLRSNTTSVGDQTISSALSISGNLTTGNIIPSTAYMSIGTLANPVKDLYLSGGTLNLGGITISNLSNIVTFQGGATDIAVPGGNFGPLSNIAAMANVGQNFVTTGGTVSGNVNIVGNLIVRGNTVQVDSNVETTTAGTLGLAANNTGDVIDIGLYGNYVNGTNKLTGLIRSPGTSNWYLFNNINATELTGNTIPVADFTSANSATLYANIISYQTSSSGQGTFGSVVSNTAIAVSSGGTGQQTLPIGQIVIGNATGAVQALANSSLAAGQYANANTIGVFTTDAYGRVVAVTNTAISGLTVSQGGTGAASFSIGQQIIGNATGALQSLANVSTTVTGALSTSNTITSITTDAWGRLTAYTGAAISGLTVSQGGTGQSSFTTGQIVIGNGTGALQPLANSALTAGQYANANTIASITTDVYGRITAVTNNAIAITAAQITSGQLGVGYGGTGQSSFTLDGIIYGNGGGALQSTLAAGSSDQAYTNQILTVTNSGVPVWASAVDGGTF